MNYKSKYRPMEILCPITQTWIPFTEEIRNSIDQKLLKVNDERRLAP
jgi:arginyl-tRNA--protein-N-Asp/Glu arginylyltransferase